MYIKQITISGLRSYRRDTTIGPFNAGFNLIAGPNGSGKSTIFMAIQLIFSDEYAKLNDQFITDILLSSGLRPNTIKKVYISITVDNSDNQLNINTRDVLISRKITGRQDQFFINKKIANRGDIKDLFGYIQTFGSYFAINQGHVAEIITASKVQLLQMLQKVSHCDEWDNKLPEINSKLDQMKEMIRENDAIIAEFQVSADKLDTQKKRIKEFQKLDMKHKSIIHCILSKQLEKIQQDLQKREEISNELFGEAPIYKDEFNIKEKKKESLKEQIEETSKHIEQLKQQLTAVIEESVEIKNTQLTIASKLENLQAEVSKKRDIEQQLEELSLEISAKKKEIDNKKKLLKNYKEDEKMMKLKSLEEELRVLYLKSRRSNFFKDKKSRDDCLQQKIVELKSEIEKTEKCLKLSKREHDKILNKEMNLLEELDKKRNELKNIETERKKMATNVALKNKEYEDCLMSINTVLKTINLLENELEELENSINKCNKKMSIVAGKSALVGRESVNQVLEEFRNHPEFDSNVKKYHGLLINKIRYEEGAEAAIEAVAGSRLFYHVVEKDDVATWIIDNINQRNLPGTVNFLSMNRIKKSRSRRTHQKFPKSCLLLDKIKYDPQFQDLMCHIFGDYYLCDTRQNAVNICKKSRKPCVTLEGSTIEPSGLIYGGAYDHQEMSLSLNQSLNDLNSQKNAKLLELNSLRQEKNFLDLKVVKTTNEKIELEVNLRRLLTLKGQTATSIDELEVAMANCNGWLEDSRKNVQMIENSIEILKEKVTKSENDIGSEFIDESSDSNQEKILKIQEDIEKLKGDMRNEIPQALELEEEIKQLEAALSFHLLKKAEQLKQSLKESYVDEDEGATLDESLKAIEEKEVAVSKTIEDLKAQNENLLGQLKKLTSEENKLKKELETIKIDMYDIANRRTKNVTIIRKLQADLEHTKQKMDELGIGIVDKNDENYQELQQLSVMQLNRELQIVVNELSTYKDTNLGVIHQHEYIKSTLTDILKYHDYLVEDFEIISKLVGVITDQKSTLIKRTISRINSAFKKFVKRIMLIAEAELVMEFEGGIENDDNATDDELIGVRIDVTLHDQNKPVDITELSGGQKAMVSLSLIFAIQEFNPSPFYLFDEVDDSLDANSRKVVGQIIKEQSNKSQFIVASFRPEFADYARQFFSVTHENRTSTVASVTRQDIINFIKHAMVL